MGGDNLERADEAAAIGGVELGRAARVCRLDSLEEFCGRECLELFAEMCVWRRTLWEAVQKSVKVKVRPADENGELTTARYFLDEP